VGDWLISRILRGIGVGEGQGRRQTLNRDRGHDMKVLFLYFSGTGNTDYVAHYVTRRLAPLPIEIELRSMEWQPAETLGGFDVLVAGFPVYACDSPPFFQAYLERLPPGEGRAAFVLCTKGAYAGSAVGHNLQRLAERGYAPLGGGSVTMPGSDGLALIPKGSRMARAALQKDYDHLKAADRLAGQMAEILSALATGESAEAFRRPLSTKVTGLALDPLWAFAYRAFADPFRTRFWADRRCETCGLCTRLCPVDNVKLRKGHPSFGDGCVLCMRCIHACPREAIQIGKLTVNKFRWHGPKGEFKPLRLRPAETKSVGAEESTSKESAR
jgi:NAD-dependent dihydropyrimidine dehydrogenase PreA subunit